MPSRILITTPHRRAFSLVELSIVLVILGLLVGGVLSGQALIHASELRGVSAEFQKYMTAMNAFRDKYYAIPGDMTNATSIWGTDPGGCPGNNTTATVPQSTTCNGDGNGMLSAAAPTANEPVRFWQHLADAGLIEGQFTGVPNTNISNTTINSTTTPNVPKSKLSNANWMIAYVNTRLITDTQYFDGTYNTNTFILTNGNSNTGLVLRPEDAWNIDTKLDDGKPGTGAILTLKNAAEANATTGCSDQNYTVATSIATSSNYLLSNSSIICTLLFKTDN